MTVDCFESVLLSLSMCTVATWFAVNHFFYDDAHTALACAHLLALSFTTSLVYARPSWISCQLIHVAGIAVMLAVWVHCDDATNPKTGYPMGFPALVYHSSSLALEFGVLCVMVYEDRRVEVEDLKSKV